MIESVSQQEDDLSEDKAKIGSKRTALAELKNQESVLVDSSASEVIDVNEDFIARRTRSRRVWIYFYKDTLKSNMLSIFVLGILYLSEDVLVWLVAS